MLIISVISAKKISAIEKVQVIVNRLRLQQMFIKDLAPKQIITAKDIYKVLKKKIIKKLLNKLLEDINILNIYAKDIKKCSIINTSVAFIIQGELKEPKKKKLLFNSFN